MRIFLFFLMLLLPLTGAFAYERITNVYEAVVPLADRSDQVRNEAIKQGLEQVLVRYSGYSSIANIVEVANELNSAQRYVIEYGIETIEQASADGLGKKPGDALWVRFNANLIDQLAHSLELPIWPTLRPTLSYVVVMELWGESHIPSASEYPALYLHLSRIFSERGIVAKPLSGSRLGRLKAQDLWEINQESADLLRGRSGTDVNLILRLHKQKQGEQKIDFLFMESQSNAKFGSETVIHQTSKQLMGGLDKGINQYMDELSTGLAFLGGGDVELDLYVQILGMRAYAEYKRVLNQIAGLEQVLSVRMESATDQSIGYLIRYQSDRALLIESITEITGIEQLSTLAPANEQSADVESGLGSAEIPIYFRYPNPTFLVSPPNVFPEASSPKALDTERVIDISERQG